MTFKDVWTAIGWIILILLVVVLSFGIFLFISEDICGYTPHLYFTKYHK